MSKKTKIIMKDEKVIIVNHSLDKVKELIAKGGMVTFKTSKKHYKTKLYTINIDEKQEQCYDVVEEEVVVNTDTIKTVETCPEDVALVYTGSAVVEEEEKEITNSDSSDSSYGE